MRERIKSALVAAMKSGDKRRTATLRLVQSAIKDRDIAAREPGKDTVSDADIVELLGKMVKQRGDSIRLYEEGNRKDLADQEREEVAIISEFLPKQMDEAEVKAAIETVIAELGATGMKDMGRTVAALKERYAGLMDFAKASGVVKALLTPAKA